MPFDRLRANGWMDYYENSYKYYNKKTKLKNAAISKEKNSP
jgi:hypothetical protein